MASLHLSKLSEFCYRLYGKKLAQFLVLNIFRYGAITNLPQVAMAAILLSTISVLCILHDNSWNKQVRMESQYPRM